MLGEAIATIVWSMNVIATANIMATRARFFLDRDGLTTDPGSVMQQLPASAAGWPAGLLPPEVSRTIRRSRAESGSWGNPIDRGRTVAGVVMPAWW
jgi:hypothetical protein